MPDAPRTPYAPDPDDADGGEEAALARIVDASVCDRDWIGERAPGARIERAELHGCMLTGAELAECTVTDAVFDTRRLDVTGLRRATLTRVVFRDCRMAECELGGARLTDVVLERCELRGAELSGARLERVELRGCDLTGIRGAEALRGARMAWSEVVENAALFATLAGIEILWDG